MQQQSFINKPFTIVCSLMLLWLSLFSYNTLYATNYVVNTKTLLQSRMNAALPGDTIIVTNGTYNNWASINFTNTNGSSSSAWIVLKAQTFNGVTFTGTTNFYFSGKHILITGFRFANGSGTTTDVFQFRNSSGSAASYCRITNITFDSFNSDSTGAYLNNSSDVDNKWVSIYGTNNRVDHCTFINKFNAGATVVVWYDNNTYPQKSTPTYHRIDSNYFKGRGYLGNNGGETIRVGVSQCSRTNGYNIVEYNLFENCAQAEPEIISNKSNFNTYRYNTFKNCKGGLTLRQGRYCSVYGNFFIVDKSTISENYGIRVIDKGHKVYNNYLEGLYGNKNSFSTMRCPIILLNGLSATTDTTDPAKAAGYFPTDSVMVAFNTIVNCSGGGGIVLGFTDGGNNTFQPKGILVANNLIKMTTGQAVYIDPANTSLTYSAEGNFYSAPNGLGLTNATGFSAKTLTFGTRTNGILAPPALVQDAATSTSSYAALLQALDVNGQTRSAIYDVGAKELNATGSVVAIPLDSTKVGAGMPLQNMPVTIIDFSATQSAQHINLQWLAENEINLLQYNIEYSKDGKEFSTIGQVEANKQYAYHYSINDWTKSNGYYRLKLIDIDGSYSYSSIIAMKDKANNSLSIYPNPASSNIHIYVAAYSSNTRINILDATGKSVKNYTVEKNSLTLNTSQFSNGLYIIQLIEKDQLLKTSPFIISR